MCPAFNRSHRAISITAQPSSRAAVGTGTIARACNNATAVECRTPASGGMVACARRDDPTQIKRGFGNEAVRAHDIVDNAG